MANRLAVPSTDPFITLNAASAVTTGNVFDLGDFQGSGHVFTFQVVNGTVTAGGLVQTQFSWDGTNWVNDASWDPSNTNGRTSIGGPARYYRVNIATALPGGGSVTIYLVVV